MSQITEVLCFVQSLRIFGTQLDFGIWYLHQEAPRHEKPVVVKEAPEPVPETLRIYVVCVLD